MRPSLYGRRSFTPEMFDATIDVAGKRLLVIEDTWATGATALSACGALYAAGAEAVVLTPIARLLNAPYFPVEHPYRQHLRGEYDVTFWPRRR